MPDRGDDDDDFEPVYPDEPRDLTVYDLAGRVSSGRAASIAAHREIARELLRVQRAISARPGLLEILNIPPVDDAS